MNYFLSPSPLFSAPIVLLVFPALPRYPILLVLVLLSLTTSPGPGPGEAFVAAQPLISITKRFAFPDFDHTHNPRILDDIMLLGDAQFFPRHASIRIPPRHHLKFKAGRALYASPVRLFDPVSLSLASFSTTFSFQINTSSSTADADADSSGGGGSGLTFIVVPDELTVGRPGPWLGVMNDACDEGYRALAVEFDTRRNDEVGDPNGNHVGIDLDSVVSAVTADAPAAFNDGAVHRAWIQYDGRRRWIEVWVGSDRQRWPERPLLSAPLDLSEHLREYMFVGFSASTGDATQVHSIRSWNFSAEIQARLRLPGQEACEEKLGVGERRWGPGPVKRKAPSAFLIFVAVVVLVLVVGLNLYCNGKRRGEKQPGTLPLPEKKQRPRPPNRARRFALSEISAATRGFSESEELGRDVKGIFYRGSLMNGSHVAVKRFSARFLNSAGVDRRRVLKEIKALSRLRHPNLVSVRGWCSDRREAMAVYEYVQNGSLDKWLYARGVLPWSRRLKVLRDVARGLCFLHVRGLAHRNVRTSSVLLGVSFGAVLGDFGVGCSWVDSGVDVYEFGVMVMEVVAGRRRQGGEGEEELVEMVWRRRERGEMGEVVDRRMRSVENVEEAIQVMKIGLLCTVSELKTRPSMEEVVGYLNGESEMPELLLCRPVALFPYNSATDLCTMNPCAPFKL